MSFLFGRKAKKTPIMTKVSGTKGSAVVERKQQVLPQY